MNTRDHTLSLLQQETKKMAPLPAVVNKLNELMNISEPDLDRIVNTIHTDVALTTRLLQIANSPFFGFLKQVSSIKEVIILLGFAGIKNLVLACKLTEQTNHLSIWHFIDERLFQRHNMAVACTAKTLAELTTDDELKTNAFIIGIIHRIGMCTLANCFSDEYQDILLEQKPIGIVEIEKFGLDSYEAGGLLCKHWNLPSYLVNAISNHNHNDEYAQKLRNLLNLATMLTPILGYGESRQTVAINIQALLDKLGINHGEFHSIWPLLPAQLSTMFEHNPNSDDTPSMHGLMHITAKLDTENIVLKQSLSLLLTHYGINVTNTNQADLILQCSEIDNKKNNGTSIICDLSPFIGTINKQTVVNWVEVRQHLILTFASLTTNTTKESYHD